MQNHKKMSNDYKETPNNNNKRGNATTKSVCLAPVKERWRGGGGGAFSMSVPWSSLFQIHPCPQQWAGYLIPATRLKVTFITTRLLVFI